MQLIIFLQFIPLGITFDSFCGCTKLLLWNCCTELLALSFMYRRQASSARQGRRRSPGTGQLFASTGDHGWSHDSWTQTFGMIHFLQYNCWIVNNVVELLTGPSSFSPQGYIYVKHWNADCDPEYLSCFLCFSFWNIFLICSPACSIHIPQCVTWQRGVWACSAK